MQGMQDWEWYGGNLCALKLAIVEDGRHLRPCGATNIGRAQREWVVTVVIHEDDTLTWLTAEALDSKEWMVKYTKFNPHESFGVHLVYCSLSNRIHKSTDHRLNQPMKHNPAARQEAVETWTHHPFLLLFGCRGVHLRWMHALGMGQNLLPDSRWTSINLINLSSSDVHCGRVWTKAKSFL